MNNVEPRRGAKPHQISHPITPSQRVSGSPAKEAGAQEAMAASKTERNASWKREIEKGRYMLSRVTPSAATDLIRDMPAIVAELYLVIEENELKRPLVLQSFPKPGLRARELYAEASAQPPELVPVKKAPRRKAT